jgi:KAP family P-loop domain
MDFEHIINLGNLVCHHTKTYALTRPFMTSPVFQQIFQYPIEDFKQHLLLEGNGRIIFSGKYGIGKTRFLEHFFQEENQKKVLGKETVIAYRLSPVNYSIAATEDILDYLKYDIIYEFLRKDYQFDEVATNYLQSLPPFLKKHFLDVMKALVYMIPEVGKEAVESFDKLMGIKDAFVEQVKDDAVSDGDRLADFMEQVENRPRSPYVKDIITRIIQKVVNRDDPASILIIDDLDRLDPEHIFRILNIFSAHFGDIDDDSAGNKFGFEKVILVCDFNNIRTLFHHRYGAEADFLGYIDKFYSTEIYHFDNREAIRSILKKVFSTLVFGANEQEQGWVLSKIFDGNLFYEIITLLLEKGFLSLRSILKMWQKPFDAFYKEISFSQKVAPIKGYSIPIAMQIKLLVDTVGDSVQLQKAFRAFEEVRFQVKGFDTAFANLIAFLTYAESDYFHSKAKSPYYVNWRGMHLAVDFTTIDNEFGKVAVFFRIDGEPPEDPQIVDDPFDPVATPERFWQAMQDALDLLRQVRFIK